MTKRVLAPDKSPEVTARLPSWVTLAAAQRPEDGLFLSGAALATLHLVEGSPEIPHALWRARLALMSAEACAGFTGRREGATGLRDALHLTKAGDDPGPAGVIYRQWARAVGRPMSVGHLGKALEAMSAEQIALCLDAAVGNPVDRAAGVIEALLADRPRAETGALILADAVLAKAMGWESVLPLIALGLQARDLRLQDEALRQACHRAVVVGAGKALALAGDLARRAGRCRAVQSHLRAKGADRALDLFLTSDAVAPAALAAFMSDRAARRLCDRLVQLGAVRELTGRDSFRLYGV